MTTNPQPWNSSGRPTQLNRAVINGQLMPLEEAAISVNHPVFLTGFGVYESIKVDNGRLFHLEEHLARLQGSAAMLQLDLGYSLSTLAAWTKMLTEALPAETYSLQILAFGAQAGYSKPLIAFLPKPISIYSPALYHAGASAITYAGQRTMPRCKSMNTLVNHLARMAAQQVNVLEAILTHNNLLFEGARSNLFVVHTKTGQLLTPPTEAVLSGITREEVIQSMADSPHPVIETEISCDLPLAEMFITSTSMHFMPITTFNGQPVGDVNVGPVTRLVSEQFEALYQRQLTSSVSNIIA